jgi:NAD(P)-dependent dehydrogenase (short-subunit alcohol dehydrogenase family)
MTDTARYDFVGRRALITGSTRGIGAATADLLLARGAHVVLHGRDADAVAAAVSARAVQYGSRIAGHAADLADRAQCRHLAMETGAIDILVNNAGIFEERDVAASDEAFWDRTVAVNLTAPWTLAQALLPSLRARRGTVVNVASDAALLGYAGASVYCATKGALVGLTRALAVELAPAVRALCICPGPAMTDMMGPTPATRAAAAEIWSAWTMLGRAADPSEIAAAIVFAASAEASFATGSVIAVDGGASAGRRL